MAVGIAAAERHVAHPRDYKHAEGLRGLEDLKTKLADLDTQKVAIERELASLKDHENDLAGF